MDHKDRILPAMLRVKHVASDRVEASQQAFFEAMRDDDKAQMQLIDTITGDAARGRTLLSAAVAQADALRSFDWLRGRRLASCASVAPTAHLEEAGVSFDAADHSSAPHGPTRSDALGTMAARAQTGDTATLTFLATQQLTELNQQFSLRYLILQEQMDSRQFTMLSNIMKAKHDTAMNIINNMN